MANEKNNGALKRAFVAGLRVAGMSREDIAGITGLTPATVQTYWGHVKKEEFKVEGTKLIENEATIQNLLEKRIMSRSSQSPVKRNNPAAKSKKQEAKTDKSEAPSGNNAKDEEDVESQH